MSANSQERKFALPKDVEHWSLAVSMIYAMWGLRALGTPLSGHIALQLVPDEETGGALGSRALIDQGLLMGEDAVAMLTAEPTGGIVWHACRGAITCRITKEFLKRRDLEEEAVVLRDHRGPTALIVKGKRLTRRFFRRDPVTLAKALLGQVLVRRLPNGQELAGRIVEVEAYLGVEDRASHSYGGRRTKRNASMWLDGGHAYVYFVYGMHWCFNVVSDREEVPTACLIRALEPLVGLDEMRRRRGKEREDELCSGPAKLAQALGV